MLEARIESPRGSLYYASEATPYDLELLRLYVHDLRLGVDLDRVRRCVAEFCRDERHDT